MAPEIRIRGVKRMVNTKRSRRAVRIRIRLIVYQPTVMSKKANYVLEVEIC